MHFKCKPTHKDNFKGQDIAVHLFSCYPGAVAREKEKLAPASQVSVQISLKLWVYIRLRVRMYILIYGQT